MNSHLGRLFLVSFSTLLVICLVSFPHLCRQACADVGMTPETESGTLDAAATDDILINEVMAANSNVVADPQGRFEDWIELHNTSKTARQRGRPVPDR